MLISLALVIATDALAQRFNLSGPLAVVAAGLLIGHRGPRDAMSDRTQTYLFGLWTLIDDSLLILLTGLEVLILQFDSAAMILATTAIPIVIASRFLAVGMPALVPWVNRLIWAKNVLFLTWAGIRGGISIAPALSIPLGPAKRRSWPKPMPSRCSA